MPAAGYYCDTVIDGGVRREPAAWRKNLIVSSAWPLVAALLRNEPGMRGILYCAVGEGDPAWDRAPPDPTPDTTRLTKEIARVALADADVRYLDAAGRAVRTPTHRLALTVTVGPAGQTRRLREFGLLGGDAVAAAGSGRLINYAIHPVIELRPGQTLKRYIRLSFRPGGAAVPGAGADLPRHWLGDEAVTVIDGVGAAIAEALRKNGVSSVRQVALLDVTRRPAGVSNSRAVELRAKARLALQTAGQLTAAPGLDQETVDQVLSGDAGGTVPADTLERLRGELGVLQVALDARFLRRMTLQALRSGPP